MRDEIKVVDVFVLPMKTRLKNDTGESYIHDQKATSIEAYVDTDGKQAETIAYVLNNFDRIKAERDDAVALKEKYKKLMDIGIELHSTFGTDINKFIESLPKKQQSFFYGWVGRHYNIIQEIRNAESEQNHN